MSHAHAMTPGPFEAPTFGPPPWAARRMRAHRARMMAFMDETADETARGDDSPDEGRRKDRGGRRGHRRGRGMGPGPWGRGGPWGPPRGPRRDRGDVRAAILLLLAEKPRHGYEIITEIADRSEGRWQPSPGSVYPVLKRLAKDDLVSSQQEDGKRVFSLTGTGRALVESEGPAWGEPWNAADGPSSDAATHLWDEGRQLGAAVWQVAQGDEPEQMEAVAAILVEARKKIYGLLAQ
jgi:DNA-binding PadR family transcriptional regulator